MFVGFSGLSMVWSNHLVHAMHVLVSSFIGLGLFHRKMTHLYSSSPEVMFAFTLVYVDDTVIDGSTPEVVDCLVHSLLDSFPIMDKLYCFLGLAWIRSVLQFLGNDIDSKEVCT
jgi:hypothetical protein